MARHDVQSENSTTAAQGIQRQTDQHILGLQHQNKIGKQTGNQASGQHAGNHANQQILRQRATNNTTQRGKQHHALIGHTKDVGLCTQNRSHGYKNQRGTHSDNCIDESRGQNKSK